MKFLVDVAVALPVSSRAGSVLTYRSDRALQEGQLVKVPLGKREVLGVVTSVVATADLNNLGESVDAAVRAKMEVFFKKPSSLREILEVWDHLPALSKTWLDMVKFVHHYYQRSIGEVVINALPPAFKNAGAFQSLKWLDSINHTLPPEAFKKPQVTLTPAQENAVEAIAQTQRPLLLFGVTGSGKTEVYLHAIADLLEKHAEAQVLFLLPEINLTPAFSELLIQRFGKDHVAIMHSHVSPVKRAKEWLRAHTGRARIVLGTRLSVFCSLPHLQLIIVDEEHDPSYKSQDGSRFSARDLAIMRAQIQQRHALPCQIVLGSATPSLETWAAAQQGRYTQVELPERIGSATWPELHIKDMTSEPFNSVLGRESWSALKHCIAHEHQALILINRRGYAPVLYCPSCQWKSNCPQCSSFRVLHQHEKMLRCHHCTSAVRAPSACPQCGHQELLALGQGTEKVEEWLIQSLQEVKKPNGEPLHIVRIDSDVVRSTKDLHSSPIHDQTVDVLVGTQMLAKGHDFQRIQLVIVVDPDGALYSSDFRASERLFSLLIQAAGRAGRNIEKASQPQMWVQTRHPSHSVFHFLSTYDVKGFLNAEIINRQQAQLPPFVYQALIRVESRSQERSQGFLNTLYQSLPLSWMKQHQVTCFAPMPASMSRLANWERSQMLIESTERKPLLLLLAQLQPQLLDLLNTPAGRGIARYAIDVDPHHI